MKVSTIHPKKRLKTVEYEILKARDGLDEIIEDFYNHKHKGQKLGTQAKIRKLQTRRKLLGKLANARDVKKDINKELIILRRESLRKQALAGRINLSQSEFNHLIGDLGLEKDQVDYYVNKVKKSATKVDPRYLVKVSFSYDYDAESNTQVHDTDLYEGDFYDDDYAYIDTEDMSPDEIKLLQEKISKERQERREAKLQELLKSQKIEKPKTPILLDSAESIDAYILDRLYPLPQEANNNANEAHKKNLAGNIPKRKFSPAFQARLDLVSEIEDEVNQTKEQEAIRKSLQQEKLMRRFHQPSRQRSSGRPGTGRFSSGTVKSRATIDNQRKNQTQVGQKNNPRRPDRYGGIGRGEKASPQELRAVYELLDNFEQRRRG